MSSRYKFHNDDGVYFVSIAVVDWIDLFTRNEYRKIVTDSINYCIENKDLIVHAWVIMSNHIHLLLSRRPESNIKLWAIMHDMKKYTSMQLIKAIKENKHESRKEGLLYMFNRQGKFNPNNINFQLWQQDNHPIEIKDSRHFYNAIEYIHYNPVKAGWVKAAGHYTWSSAGDYEGNQGFVHVSLPDISLVR